MADRPAAPFTPFHDVNEILSFFVAGVAGILGDNLLGIYLTGSLSYGAFHYDRSDIDLTVILRKPAARTDLGALKSFHNRIEAKFGKWAKRLECSYTPVEMLPEILPPARPRPWYWGGDGILYEEAQYGNEWIINKYFLYNFAIPLSGPGFQQLTGPVAIEEVQKASLRDLFTEWEPRLTHPEWSQDSHLASYLVLNLCRILCTVSCPSAPSKDAATAWVRTHYPAWANLIDAADGWHYGIEFNAGEQAPEFLSFVIDQASRTELYQRMRGEIESLRARRAAVDR